MFWSGRLGSGRLVGSQFGPARSLVLAQAAPVTHPSPALPSPTAGGGVRGMGGEGGEEGDGEGRREGGRTGQSAGVAPQQLAVSEEAGGGGERGRGGTIRSRLPRCLPARPADQ